MWGHYHPSDKERDETECRLFEITKNISNYGVGRLVYNKYETSYDSENYNLLNDEQRSRNILGKKFFCSFRFIKYYFQSFCRVGV